VPVQFAIDPDARLVAYLVRGSPTPAEARAFLAAVLAHPDFERGFHFLGDRRAAAPSAGYGLSAAAAVNDRRGLLAPCKWAVVTADTVGSGVARMVAMAARRSGVEIRPFGSVGEAAAWLDLPADYSPPPTVAAS
jgi:hypothetical protein